MEIWVSEQKSDHSLWSACGWQYLQSTASDHALANHLTIPDLLSGITNHDDDLKGDSWCHRGQMHCLTPWFFNLCHDKFEIRLIACILSFVSTLRGELLHKHLHLTIPIWLHCHLNCPFQTQKASWFLAWNLMSSFHSDHLATFKSQSFFVPLTTSALFQHFICGLIPTLWDHAGVVSK